MPYASTPSGAQYHYHLYGDGPEKVIFLAGFACCKGCWKAPIAHLLNIGKITTETHTPTTPTHTHTTLCTQADTPYTKDNHCQCEHSGAVSSADPPSPVSASPSPCPSPAPDSSSSSSSSPSNRYQICVFDTRGFGKSTYGSASRFTTTNMAEDTLAILIHLGWIRKLNTNTSTPTALDLPVLHITAWSLGGMIAQELSYTLLQPSSPYQHQLCSLVFTSSSPGGLKESSPDERNVYLVRNQPPTRGFIIILQIILAAITHVQRIRHLMRLHYSDDYLDKPYEGEWPVQDIAQCFTETQQDNNTVKAMDDDMETEDIRACSMSDAQTTITTARPQTNREALCRLYASRSPFDRNVLLYIPAMIQHIFAVYTHAFSKERAKIFTQWNSQQQQQRQESNDAQPHRRVYPMVIIGDGDRLICPQNSVTLASYLHCPCIIVNHAGHMMYVEHASLYANILHNHFSTSKERGNKSLYKLMPLTPPQPHIIHAPTHTPSLVQEIIDHGTSSSTSTSSNSTGSTPHFHDAEWYYEDDLVKIIDYSEEEVIGKYHYRRRRLSTLSTTLTTKHNHSGSIAHKHNHEVDDERKYDETDEEEEEDRDQNALTYIGADSSVHSSITPAASPSAFSSFLSRFSSLLSCFLLWKLISTTPLFRVLRSSSSLWWSGSFVSELLRPLILLHQHIRAILIYKLKQILAVLHGW